MEKCNTEIMLAHVEQWKESGMSRRAYAQAVGISKSKFEYWVRKVKVSDGERNKYPGFVEVSSLAEDLNLGNDKPHVQTSQQPQIVLTFPSGLTLNIYG